MQLTPKETNETVGPCPAAMHVEKKGEREAPVLCFPDFPFSYQNCSLARGDGTAPEKFTSRKHFPASCHMGFCPAQSLHGEDLL